MIMKSILKWLGTIIQISLVIFTAVIYTLSNKKMGLVRHFTYQNYKWDDINLRLYFICILSLLIIAFIISSYVKYKKSVKFRKTIYFKINIMFIALSIISTVFAIISSTDKLLTYYVFVLATIFILIIELLKISFLQMKK
ncbi:MAG TPA: hypothetical protein DIT16_02240 [Clostridium sp.]|nr:hypothetical protein [Clostridium sp.]HCO73655.1 hypothetical protein [Clostridium sp.]